MKIKLLLALFVASLIVSGCKSRDKNPSTEPGGGAGLAKITLGY